MTTTRGAPAQREPSGDMRTARHLMRSSAVRTLHVLCAAVIAFFMMPFLVRHLGERWYGIWVVIASVGGSYYLMDLGLAAAVTRFVAKQIAAKDDEGVNRVVNTAFAIYSCLGLLVLAATCGAAAAAGWVVSDPGELRVVRLVVLIAGCSLAAEFPVKAFAGIIASYVRYDLLVYSRVLHLALSTTLTVILIRRGAGILGLAITQLACMQVANVYYLGVARYLFRPLRIRRAYVTRDTVSQLVSYSSWAFVSQVANQFRFKIDSFVIGSILSAVAVTHYAVALRLVEYFVDLVYRATNMMTPVFTQYWVQGRYDETREKLLFLTRINVVLALFGGGVIVIVGRAFIVRWMGEPFAVAYPVLVVLMIAMITELVGCYADNLFYAIAKHQYLAVINVIEAALNVVLSIALVHAYGLVGAALGTAIPLLFFRLVVIPRYVSRFVGLQVRRYYANLLPATAFTLAYLFVYYLLVRSWLVPTFTSVAAVALLAAPAYIAVIPFVAFSRDERRYLLRVAGLSHGILSDVRQKRPAWSQYGSRVAVASKDVAGSALRKEGV